MNWSAGFWPFQWYRSPANAKAKAIQMALRTVASRSETAFSRPRKTPRSSASMSRTKALKATQNNSGLKGMAIPGQRLLALVNQLHCFPDYVSGDFETTGTEFVDGVLRGVMEDIVVAVVDVD